MLTQLATPLTKAEQALTNAKTPQESKQVETLAALARAWAKEQQDYELMFDAGKVYIQAYCKTTELILPTIGFNHGNQYVGGDEDVTPLIDYGFTRKQWSRRKQILYAYKRFDDYQDHCVETGEVPTPFGLLKFINSPHVSYNSGENEWYTPPEIIEAARRVLGEIDLDPASSDTANEIVKAKIYFTAKDNGLKYSWDGRVWMNPPYSSDLIQKFTDKLTNHYGTGDISQAIVLVNNATETNWFQYMLTESSACCLLRGRVKFIDMDGNPSGAPLQGQAILYFGDNVKSFTDEFAKLGIVLYGRRTGQDL